MTPSQITLFEEIINCPYLSNQTPGQCRQILDVQSLCGRRQVPEPWSGDLNNASFLILGSNPALVCNEVFPSRQPNWKVWTDMGDGKTMWTNQNVIEYFEGRFGKANCPALPGCVPYFNITENTVLSIHNGSISQQKVQNKYWMVYNMYCRAIDSSFQNYSYVISDFVHCKSSKEIGVQKAFPFCRRYTQDIIKAFAQNQSSKHSILIFGGASVAEKKLKWLSSCGYNIAGPQKIVGHYPLISKQRTQDIYKTTFNVCGIIIDLYYNLPAPSGSNHNCCPATFMGNVISW